MFPSHVKENNQGWNQPEEQHPEISCLFLTRVPISGEWPPSFKKTKERIGDRVRRARDSCLTHEATHYLSATGNKGIARRSQQYSTDPHWLPCTSSWQPATLWDVKLIDYFLWQHLKNLQRKWSHKISKCKEKVRHGTGKSYAGATERAIWPEIFWSCKVSRIK